MSVLSSKIEEQVIQLKLMQTYKRRTKQIYVHLDNYRQERRKINCIKSNLEQVR